MQEINIKWQDCKTAPLCGVDLLVTDGTYIESAYAYAIHGWKIGGMSGSPLKRVKNITAWAYAEVAPKQLSDLEIVQKALFVTGTTLIMTDGEWQIKAFNKVVTEVIAGGSMESLLTWAKQTIGVE